DLERAAVGGLHDARAAAGHYDEVALLALLTIFGNESRKLAGFVVEMTLSKAAFGALHVATGLRQSGVLLESRFGIGQAGFGGVARHDLRAAEDDHGGANARFAQHGLGLVEF